MKRPMNVSVLALGLSLIAPLTAFAAPTGDHGAGNGGGVHFCPGNSQQEMYDLYEGRVRYGLKYAVPMNLSVDEYLTHALERIRSVNYSMAKKIQDTLRSIQSGKLIFNDKTVLTRIQDANILLVDEGCEYKQLANWDEISGNILVNQKIYDQMNPFNQAAFLLHEAIYKYDRMSTSAKSSDRTRQIVATLFSDLELKNLLYPLRSPDDFQSLDRSTPEKEGMRFDIFGAVVTLNQSTLEAAKNINLKVEWRDETATKIINEISSIQEQLTHPTPRGEKRTKLIEKLYELGYSEAISHIMFLNENRLKAEATLNVLENGHDAYGRSEVTDYLYWSDTLLGRRVSISVALSKHSLKKDTHTFRYFDGITRKKYRLDCATEARDPMTGNSIETKISSNQVSSAFKLVVDDKVISELQSTKTDLETFPVNCSQGEREISISMKAEAQIRYQVIMGR